MYDMWAFPRTFVDVIAHIDHNSMESQMESRSHTTRKPYTEQAIDEVRPSGLGTIFQANGIVDMLCVCVCVWGGDIP